MIKRLLTILSFTLAVSSVSAALLPDAKFRRLDTPNGLSNSQVNCILRDSKGYVWMGTAYGLNRYDGYRFKTFYANVRDTTTIRGLRWPPVVADGHELLYLRPVHRAVQP